MTETFITTKFYKTGPSTFGGIIYYSDFNTEYSGNINKNGSAIAGRIEHDFAFDKQCEKNFEARLRK